MINILKTSRYERERDKFVRNNPITGNALIRTLKKFSHNPIIDIGKHDKYRKH